MLCTKRIEAGDWGTVESFWNAEGTAFFNVSRINKKPAIDLDRGFQNYLKVTS